MCTNSFVEIARQIRQRRLSLGLSQKELGDRIGVAHQQIFNYESGTGDLPVERLIVLCVALKLNPSSLMSSVTLAQQDRDNRFRDLLELNRAVEASCDEPMARSLIKFLRLAHVHKKQRAGEAGARTEGPLNAVAGEIRGVVDDPSQRAEESSKS